MKDTPPNPSEIPLINRSHPFTPLKVANSFLVYRDAEARKTRRREPVTAKKLIKLVYFFYSWYMAQNKQRPFSERPVAAKTGPVFETLREIFEYPNAENRDMEVWVPRITGRKSYFPYIEEHDRIDNETKVNAFAVMVHVWRAYGTKPFKELSEYTHKEGGAWQQLSAKLGAELNDAAVAADGRDGIREYLATRKR